MDKQGIIREHSKIKLELYKLYLERYLYVLLVTPFFKSICVHDVFAGSGISRNEEKGSSVIAAETIAQLISEQNQWSKNVFLLVNDADTKKFLMLQQHMSKYQFATTTNNEADRYIQSWSPMPGSHNLFFIDPHGYTQVSVDNLKRLFSRETCDFLIFIPVYHIYRFLRKEEDSEQLKPIANFLDALGIKEIDAVRVSNVEDFSDLIVSGLRGISNTEFVYKQIIENRTSNSKYGLFFITHNILGAEKFLDAQEKLKKVIEDSHTQMSFNFVGVSNKALITQSMKKSTEYDNTQLYKFGIKTGLLPKEVTQQLRQLERDGKLVVSEIRGKKRNNRGFYIGYKQYRNSEKVITLRLTH